MDIIFYITVKKLIFSRPFYIHGHDIRGFFNKHTMKHS